MKLIANLLIAISLALGALSAVSAYRPSIDALQTLDESELQQLTINGNQGERLSDGVLKDLPDLSTDQRTELYNRIAEAPNNPARAEILAKYAPDHPLTAPGSAGFTQPVLEYEKGNDASNTLSRDKLQALAAAGETRVTVKEFSFTRWQHWWLLALAAAGLGAGAFLIKASKPSAEAAKSAEAADTTHLSPTQALEEIDRTLTAVRAAVHDAPNEHDALKRIVTDLGKLQLGPIDAVVSSRETFVNAHGLTAYATFMDQFAGLERKINRAWSTAADNHLPEATLALDDAIARLEPTKAQLPA